MGFRSDVRDFFGAILGLVRPSGPWCFPVREGGAFVGEQHLFSSRRLHKPLFFLRGRRQGRQPLNIYISVYCFNAYDINISI